MNDFSGPQLCRLDATEVVALLRKGEVSPGELVEASLERIEEVEPQVNAMVTVCADRARAAARDWDGGDPGEPGWLGGLPIGVKDLTDVAGVRTTYGTLGYADHVPDRTDPLIERLEARGGIVVGKTNTPEMGAGGNTFNQVFGMTRNPWDTSRNAGGSSGGAAVSLATGEVWLSHGSDLAGSLRTPAAYCGVVGFRPTPGVAGGGPDKLGFHTEGVKGPMARTVADCALFLDAMAGFDPVWPISWPAPQTPYLAALDGKAAKPRIAYTATLNGFAAVEPEMDDCLQAALRKAQAEGAIVEEACPEVAGLEKTYVTLRAMMWAAGAGRQREEVQRHYKKTLAENIEVGRKLTIDDVYDAQINRTKLYHEMRWFLSRFDVLACPVIGLEAGPVEEEYPAEVDGLRVKSYIDWLKFSYLPVVTALPALSIPVGRTKSGMPVGLQLIGPPRGEARLLQVAKFVEDAVGYDSRPIDPRSGPINRR